MSLTIKLVSLIDKLHLQSFFIEKENRVMINFSINPSKIEEFIDDHIKVDGKKYEPNQFELDVLAELEKWH